MDRPIIPAGVRPPLPVDITFNRFSVGVTRNNVSILAPNPVYNREAALNLVCWLATLANIGVEEIAEGMKAIQTGTEQTVKVE